VTTQHCLATQIVDLADDDTASATTYYFANHFGKGKFTGQSVTAYGRYEDKLVHTEDGWRINRRQVVIMGPYMGNISIFGPPP